MKINTVIEELKKDCFTKDDKPPSRRLSTNNWFKREAKTIMGINIARAKTEEMVFKEIGVALLSYNLIRKIVAKSASQTPFSPETDLFQKLYSISTPTLVDRKGPKKPQN